MSYVVRTVARSRTPWLMNFWLAVPCLKVNYTFPKLVAWEVHFEAGVADNA